MMVPSGNAISILLSTTAESELAAWEDPAHFAGSAPGGSPSNCTGTNTDGGSGLSVPRRTWLRQFHSRPRHLGDVCARLFSLSDNPQLLFHAPASTPLNSGDDLHPAACP